ncbi:hypothetical protein Ahy_A10g049484 [Arachis hypogaea]|uniref:Uncharacterized protein n=1 Tax=Arachis hypogaea TaxID=3818 RepID=A0A445B787_ARAHY|nr:hypothetical protein Ahy_A10g049484 [Arachis hypogaea]
MADEVSNVNGGSSTSDSVPVITQSSADVISHPEGNMVNESVVVTSFQIENNGCNICSCAFRQHVDKSQHDLVNLLTQQMTTILNPMMADHETKFERFARQVERIARIIDYDMGDRQRMEENCEGIENLLKNENDNVLIGREILM